VVLRRNVMLVNSLSSPTYLPSSMDNAMEVSTARASLEDFQASLADTQEQYQQQVWHTVIMTSQPAARTQLDICRTSLPQGELRNPTIWGWLQEASRVMPYGGPFSEALGAAGLSHYAAQLLYKCASDPVTQDAFGRPNLPPAAIAGVHLFPSAMAAAAAGGGSGGGAAGGGGGGGAGGDQRIISYSSEPTGTSSSGLAKFPSEPFGRAPRNVYPTYSAFDLPPGEFHDVAWVCTVTLCSLP